MLENTSDSTCTSKANLGCRVYQSVCLVWFLHFLGVKSGKAPCLVLYSLVELKFDIMKGYGVYAKPGIAKKKI